MNNSKTLQLRTFIPTTKFIENIRQQASMHGQDITELLISFNDRAAYNKAAFEDGKTKIWLAGSPKGSPTYTQWSDTNTTKLVASPFIPDGKCLPILAFDNKAMENMGAGFTNCLFEDHCEHDLYDNEADAKAGQFMSNPKPEPALDLSKRKFEDVAPTHYAVYRRKALFRFNPNWENYVQLCEMMEELDKTVVLIQLTDRAANVWNRRYNEKLKDFNNLKAARKAKGEPEPTFQDFFQVPEVDWSWSPNVQDHEAIVHYDDRRSDPELFERENTHTLEGHIGLNYSEKGSTYWSTEVRPIGKVFTESFTMVEYEKPPEKEPQSVQKPTPKTIDPTAEDLLSKLEAAFSTEVESNLDPDQAALDKIAHQTEVLRKQAAESKAAIVGFKVDPKTFQTVQDALDTLDKAVKEAVYLAKLAANCVEGKGLPLTPEQEAASRAIDRWWQVEENRAMAANLDLAPSSSEKPDDLDLLIGKPASMDLKTVMSEELGEVPAPTNSIFKNVEKLKEQLKDYTLTDEQLKRLNQGCRCFFGDFHKDDAFEIPVGGPLTKDQTEEAIKRWSEEQKSTFTPVPKKPKAKRNARSKTKSKSKRKK